MHLFKPQVDVKVVCVKIYSSLVILSTPYSFFLIVRPTSPEMMY